MPGLPLWAIALWEAWQERQAGLGGAVLAPGVVGLHLYSAPFVAWVEGLCRRVVADNPPTDAPPGVGGPGAVEAGGGAGGGFHHPRPPPPPLPPAPPLAGPPPPLPQPLPHHLHHLCPHNFSDEALRQIVSACTWIFYTPLPALFENFRFYEFLLHWMGKIHDASTSNLAIGYDAYGPDWRRRP